MKGGGTVSPQSDRPEAEEQNCHACSTEGISKRLTGRSSYILFHPFSRHIYTEDPRLVLYLVRKVEGGSLSSFSAVDAHHEWHRSLQEVMQRCRDDGQVDVLPLEGEQQSGDALGHCHQTLVVWGEEGLASIYMYRDRKYFPLFS